MTTPNRTHHQQRWDTTIKASPSIYFGRERQLTGIYTLEFTRNNERYVGQTVNLINRISSHMRRWDDISAVNFVECGHEELDDLEVTMITQTQRDHVLRNKMFTSNPAPNAELDLIIDRQEQIEWLKGVAPAYSPDQRTIEAERRQRTQKNFEALQSSGHYPDLLKSISHYVSQVIPWPSVTGGTYWSMTAMPSTSRTPQQRRLLTLNAHNVELLRIHEFWDPAEVWVAMNLAPGHITQTQRKEWGVEHSTAYKSYGPCDVLAVGLNMIAEALSVPEVLTASREIALHLMKKGPSTFARFHSDAFLDAVLTVPVDNVTS